MHASMRPPLEHTCLLLCCRVEHGPFMEMVHGGHSLSPLPVLYSSSWPPERHAVRTLFQTAVPTSMSKRPMQLRTSSSNLGSVESCGSVPPRV